MWEMSITWLMLWCSCNKLSKFIVLQKIEYGYYLNAWIETYLAEKESQITLFVTAVVVFVCSNFMQLHYAIMCWLSCHLLVC